MVCPGTTHISAGITGVDHSWCAMKQECCYGSFSSLSPPFRSSLACYCYKHRRAGLHSRADPSIQWILPLCSNFFFFFSSHTSPIVKLILCPHKLLLWTRAVFHLPDLKHHLKHMAGFCLNTLDLIFLFPLHFWEARGSCVPAPHIFQSLI